MLDGVDYDQAFMLLALIEARDAQERGERPFGCVIASDRGEILGKGSGTGSDQDPTAHSELAAIREACSRPTGGPGLLIGCTLYSTHEPCTMCCGGIMHAKLSRVVWGSYRSDVPELFRTQLNGAPSLLHNTSTPPETKGGVLRAECISLFARELSEMANERAGF